MGSAPFFCTAFYGEFTTEGTERTRSIRESFRAIQIPIGLPRVPCRSVPSVVQSKLVGIRKKALDDIVEGP
jgi:hypothetical protein